MSARSVNKPGSNEYSRSESIWGTMGGQQSIPRIEVLTTLMQCPLIKNHQTISYLFMSRKKCVCGIKCMAKLIFSSAPGNEACYLDNLRMFMLVSLQDSNILWKWLWISFCCRRWVCLWYMHSLSENVLVTQSWFHPGRTRNNPFPDTSHSLKSFESTKSLTSQQAAAAPSDNRMGQEDSIIQQYPFDINVQQRKYLQQPCV